MPTQLHSACNIGKVCAAKDKVGSRHIPSLRCPCKFCTNCREALRVGPHIKVGTAIRHKLDENAGLQKANDKLKYEMKLQDKHVQWQFQEIGKLIASLAHSRRQSQKKIEDLQAENVRLTEYNMLITSAVEPTLLPTTPPPTVEVVLSQGLNARRGSDFDEYVVRINTYSVGRIWGGVCFFRRKLDRLICRSIEQYYYAAAHTTPKEPT